MTEPLLVIDRVSKQYRLPREHLLSPAPVVQALDDVRFTRNAGRSVGLAGEAGSCKSALERRGVGEW